mmetsp:Transcript_94253/g.266153  ORF Transcript_94253/g.266153 Transcript_94253/m.266153 type:complete len:247 (+) Transcript_94253:1089-1829(+)
MSGAPFFATHASMRASSSQLSALMGTPCSRQKCTSAPVLTGESMTSPAPLPATVDHLGNSAVPPFGKPNEAGKASLGTPKARNALVSSPIDAASKPMPQLFRSFMYSSVGFAFTAKQWKKPSLGGNAAWRSATCSRTSSSSMNKAKGRVSEIWPSPNAAFSAKCLRANRFFPWSPSTWSDTMRASLGASAGAFWKLALMNSTKSTLPSVTFTIFDNSSSCSFPHSMPRLFMTVPQSSTVTKSSPSA